MPYVTLPQLAEVPGALELAQVASDKHVRPVSAGLMDLRGGDRSGFAADQVALADARKPASARQCKRRTGIIDGYLARRYTLPLARTQALLVTWARAVVLQAHDDRNTDERTDPVVRLPRCRPLPRAGGGRQVQPGAG